MNKDNKDVIIRKLERMKKNRESFVEYKSCKILYYPEREAYRFDHALIDEISRITLVTDGDVDIKDVDVVANAIIESENLLFTEYSEEERKNFKDDVLNQKEHFKEKNQQVKNENYDFIIHGTIFLGSFIFSAMIGSFFPLVIGIILIVIIYNRQK
jgi:hypothetical protein